MRVRIEAVISTAGNDEQYVGHHLGLHIIGRPLKKMVVTFEEDVTETELQDLCEANVQEVSKAFILGPNAIQLNSFSFEVMPIP